MQTATLCYRSDLPAVHEESMEVAPFIAKKGPLLFLYYGFCATTENTTVKSVS